MNQDPHDHWIGPTFEICNWLEVILTSITSVRISGQKVLIEPERHRNNLYICNYRTWPNYD